MIGFDPTEEQQLIVETVRQFAANEVRWKEYSTEDADLLLVAFGTVGRVCQSVVREAREEGI